MQFDSNTFEHDYIIQILTQFIDEAHTKEQQAAVIDKYAGQLTAFMNGKIMQAMESDCD